MTFLGHFYICCSIYIYTGDNDKMYMEEIELNILRLIHEDGKSSRHVTSDKIAAALKISDQETRDFLDMLESQSYVRLDKTLGGNGGIYFARLTPPGRLLLTHPDYMLNKGYGDARDVLKALERAVIDSTDIPLSEKGSLIGKLKDLYHDPYMQSIGSGLIVEGLKKAFGV